MHIVMHNLHGLPTTKWHTMHNAQNTRTHSLSLSLGGENKYNIRRRMQLNEGRDRARARVQKRLYAHVIDVIFDFFCVLPSFIVYFVVVAQMQFGSNGLERHKHGKNSYSRVFVCVCMAVWCNER